MFTGCFRSVLFWSLFILFWGLLGGLGWWGSWKNRRWLLDVTGIQDGVAWQSRQVLRPCLIHDLWRCTVETEISMLLKVF